MANALVGACWFLTVWGADPRKRWQWRPERPLALIPFDLARPVAPTFSRHERGVAQISIAAPAGHRAAEWACRQETPTKRDSVLSLFAVRRGVDRRPDDRPRPELPADPAGGVLVGLAMDFSVVLVDQDARGVRARRRHGRGGGRPVPLQLAGRGGRGDHHGERLRGPSPPRRS